MAATLIERRQFLALGLTGLVGLAVGTQSQQVSELLGGEATAAPPVYRLTVTDAMVEMVDLEPVYHWVFADEKGAHLPGPLLHAFEGDAVTIEVTNALDEPHGFAIHDTGITTGAIGVGESRTIQFTAPPAGTYIYMDPLNAPVNRLLGLHGVMIVLPRSGSTPYTSATPNLTRLFSDLGNSAHFPGEPWTPPRTRVWHVHSVDVRWNQKAEAGTLIDPAKLVTDFQTAYFTLNGDSGFFASHNAKNAPTGRVGQPHLIRIVNTGLCAHSLHIHGNHVFLCSENGVHSSNVKHIDTWRVGPCERSDWLLPFTRPPDICGAPNRPLREVMAEELSYRDSYGLMQVPIEYPMHCHMEPSQTAKGGNYPGGLVAHWSITGDVDKDFSSAGFDCLPTDTLAVPHVHGLDG
jgi:FtsP/CotA-like multicopper oxidase with cupredoxin domain